jgi:hypothetical protein
MHILKYTGFSTFACSLLLLLSHAASLSATPKPSPAASQGNHGTPPATVQGDGERVFKQNCARCHTAPEGFSSHISGTIVRHMRVRASLSREDERALLRFLNP